MVCHVSSVRAAMACTLHYVLQVLPCVLFHVIPYVFLCVLPCVLCASVWLSVLTCVLSYVHLCPGQLFECPCEVDG